jgi:hypothetical protein
MKTDSAANLLALMAADLKAGKIPKPPKGVPETFEWSGQVAGVGITYAMAALRGHKVRNRPVNVIFCHFASDQGVALYSAECPSCDPKDNDGEKGEVLAEVPISEDGKADVSAATVETMCPACEARADAAFAKAKATLKRRAEEKAIMAEEHFPN